MGESEEKTTEYDRCEETARLVAALLSTGFSFNALCAALTVEPDTLRRWRRGVPASHMGRKLMRCVLVLRSMAPGVLTEVSFLPVEELGTWAGQCPFRLLSGADVARGSIERWVLMGQWQDGAERG